MSEDKKYAVWVGGVADYFDDEEAAKAAAEMWLEDGYDDVEVEAIEEIE